MGATDLMFGFPGVPEYVTGVRNFAGKTLYIRNQLAIGIMNPTAQFEMFTQAPFTQGLRLVKNSSAITDMYIGGNQGGTTFIVDNTTGNLTITCANGNLTTPNNFTCGGITNTGAATIAGSLGASGGTSIGNSVIPAGNATASTTIANCLFAGASTVYFRVLWNPGSNNIGGGNTVAGISFGALLMANQTFVTATTGTHALAAAMVMRALTVTNTGATVTNTATLYIEGASGATVSGINYALWIDAGQVRIDDNIAAPTPTAGVAIANFYGANATNFLGDPNLWLRMNVNGTNYKIPLYT